MAGNSARHLERATIEVRVRDIGQLFSSLDPSPFTERDLDEDAEALHED